MKTEDATHYLDITANFLKSCVATTAGRRIDLSILILIHDNSLLHVDYCHWFYNSVWMLDGDCSLVLQKVQGVFGAGSGHAVCWLYSAISDWKARSSCVREGASIARPSAAEPGSAWS
jgi:hypothetical protein